MTDKQIQMTAKQFADGIRLIIQALPTVKDICNNLYIKDNNEKETQT